MHILTAIRCRNHRFLPATQILYRLSLQLQMRRSFSSRRAIGSISLGHPSLGYSLTSHVRSLVLFFPNEHILTTPTVYGLGLSSPQIVSHIWSEPNTELQDPTKPRFPPVYNTLRDNSLHTLVMVSIGTITGGLLMIKIVKHVSPKVIQFWGFLALFVLFMVTGSAWTALLKPGARSGLIVLYVLSHIAFNLGPNVTTFIVSDSTSPPLLPTTPASSNTSLDSSRNLPHALPLHMPRYRRRLRQTRVLARTNLPRILRARRVRLGEALLRPRAADYERVHGSRRDNDVLACAGDAGSR